MLSASLAKLITPLQRTVIKSQNTPLINSTLQIPNTLKCDYSSSSQRYFLTSTRNNHHETLGNMNKGNFQVATANFQGTLTTNHFFTIQQLRHQSVRGYAKNSKKEKTAAAMLDEVPLETSALKEEEADTGKTKRKSKKKAEESGEADMDPTASEVLTEPGVTFIPTTKTVLNLDKVIKQIEKTFGQGTVMKLDGQVKPLSPDDVISTGSLSLDLALGIGGLPRGRIVEIFGPESSGKTTLALHVIAEAQKSGKQCVFVDAEHALDVNWARKLGIKTENLLVAQPDSGEQALEIIDTLVQTGQIDVIVLDSVAALVPRAELDGEMGAHQIGLQARLMSQAMRKLTATLSKHRTLLIFLNQIRMKVGVMFGNPETTSGGNALKYAASMRLDIRRTGSIKKGEVVTANQIRVKVAKNKLAPPFRQAEFDIEFGHGISKAGEIIDLGIKTGVLEKSGAWYAVATDGKQLGQGREKAKQHLIDNPEDADAIEKMIREKVIEEESSSHGVPDSLYAGGAEPMTRTDADGLHEAVQTE